MTAFDLNLAETLWQKDKDARIAIAERIGVCLAADDTPDAERRAAETLARELLHDAVARVRFELSCAVRTSRTLPSDIALAIAHDVDSIAQPFLEVTDVFSEAEWERLVVTVSMASRGVLAGRGSMSPRLALAIAQLGDSDVVETLIDNPICPMTVPICGTIIDRFDPESAILDKLAGRDDLVADIVVKLITKVSDTVRERLARVHGLTPADPVFDLAAHQTLVQLVRDTPASGFPNLAASLNREGRLTHEFLLASFDAGLFPFVVAAFAKLSELGARPVRTILLHRSAGEVFELFKQTGIPPEMRDRFWDALSDVRTEMEAARAANSAIARPGAKRKPGRTRGQS